MKIVHVVYSLAMGGAEVLVAQLCRLQRSYGHEIHIFAYSELNVIGEELKAEGFDIYVPGEAHPLRTMQRYYKKFRKIKPDVVHCHNVAPTIHAVVAARLAGVQRVISTRHRLELFPYNRSEERKYNLACWLCDWITGICDVTCDNIRRGPLARNSRIVRVYNGTAPVQRTNSMDSKKRGFTLVFIGRLVPEKAIDTLIRALAKARLQKPDIALWIVGDGRSRLELENLVDDLGVREEVKFWGQRSDTAPFFSAADAFAMSSYSEGLPMSLLQAMSLGVPAILTDVDGMGEVLRLTGGGLLVPVGDVEAMAVAIVRLANDPDLHKTLSQNASTGYETEFTLERMTNDYLRLYKDPAVST